MNHETTKQSGWTCSPARRRRPRDKAACGLWLGLILLGFLALGVAGGFLARLRAVRRFQREVVAARDEIDSGLFALASRRLSRLVEEWPEHAELAYQLGRCAAARGDMDTALKSWARIPPDSLWAGPAAIEFAQGAIPLGRLTEAERMLRKVVGRGGPEQTALRRLLLTLLGQQGRLTEARGVIETLWRSAGSIRQDQEADRLAMLREHMGLDLEPFPMEWNQSRLEEGSATAGDDDRRTLALARAHLAMSAGDFDRARTKLQWCRERSPGDPAVWKSWLDWAVASGRPDEAREATEHVPADLLDDAEILALRAWFARQRGDIATERRMLEQLVSLEPGRPLALIRLAEILLQAGETDAAAMLRRRKDELDVALDRYLRLYREDRFADHLSELATLAEGLGRRFEAGAFWELLAVRDPANPESRRVVVRLGTVSPPRSGARERLLSAELGTGSFAGRSGTSGVPTGTKMIPQFEDRSIVSGLARFTQDNGVSPIRQLPESFSGGVGLLDFDRDGYLDVYCVQGGAFPPEPGGATAGDRLYRNRGDGTFEDRTRESRIGAMSRGYGHGIAVGDYDNDGHPDVLVTRWRSYSLYHNRGDGTFEDRTKEAGLSGDRDWPTSAAFADLDNDGDLDLYVCHYGVWDTGNPRVCKDPSGTIVLACDPRVIESLPDHVFRNDSGRFVDVTAESGIVDRDGRGLGVVAADLDGDRRIDLFVANDSTANFLFRNVGGFRFEEVGHSAGVAANAQGGYQAGMGVACGDLDGDGRLDLTVTNYYGESTTLFHNLGGGLFADHSAAAGLAAPSRHRLGFGAACLDVNNDGWVDLMTANGHVSDSRPLFPYAMRPQLFLGNASGALSDVTELAGEPFQQLHVGRGLAIGDLNNDGWVDAVMVAQNEPLVQLHNRSGEKGIRNHFMEIRLEGTKSNRDGVGAVVSVTAGGRSRVAQRIGGGSFQSASDARLHFGLGRHVKADSIAVHWPSGQVNRYENLAGDREYLVREGEASPKILFSIHPRN